MKRKLTLLLCALFGITALTAALRDDDPITLLLQKLEAYSQANPREKVHLHLDKPHYAIGDNIWFTAYLVDGRTEKPSSVSSLLYVDLIDERDSIRQQLLLPVDSGITWGDFKLPDTLKEGNYRIRAYTQWMRNAGPSHFFDKTIKIANGLSSKIITKATYDLSSSGINGTVKFMDPNEKPYTSLQVTYKVMAGETEVDQGKATTNSSGDITVNFPSGSKTGIGSYIVVSATPDGKHKETKTIPVKLPSEPDIQFLPEGGHLVSGLPGKLAIKAVDVNGMGKDIKGVISDEAGAEVSRFETTHLGMGSVFFTPRAGKAYTAKVSLADGSSKTIKLPVADEKGYVLAVSRTADDNMRLNVYFSPELVNKGTLNLVVQHNGKVLHRAKFSTADAVIKTDINTAAFPSGIVQVTLFDPGNVPVCERLAFVKNKANTIDLNVTGLQKAYKPRSAVNLQVNASSAGKPVAGKFSVSVTNASVVFPDPDNESNIFTSLLLTSDLAGYVEKPNYYFSDDTEKTAADLDNLLLTQGWRNISWSVLQNSPLVAPEFSAENTLTISGILTEKGKPVSKGHVMLQSRDDPSFQLDTLTDERGRFVFDRMDFDDGEKFILKPTGAKYKMPKISVDHNLGHTITPNINYGDVEVNVNAAVFDYIKQSNKYFAELIKKGLLESNVEIESVDIAGDRRKETKGVPEYSANLNGPGNADDVVTERDLRMQLTLLAFLKGRSGIYFLNGMGYSNRVVGTLKNSNTLDPMLVVIDGNRTDFENLWETQIKDIASIEILLTAGKMALYNYKYGVIVVTTKRGHSKYSDDFFEDEPEAVTGRTVIRPRGISISREFYSPKYETSGSGDPDLRTTILWNPYIAMGASGTANLTYYNADLAGYYRMVIEGMDGQGRIARKVINYQVN